MLDSLHILCFGDSLTAGWSSPWDAKMHPYAPAMQSIMEDVFQSTKVTSDVHGLPGDQVTSPPGRFVRRINAAYEKTQAPYDWAIILGGTNDLAQGRDSDEIYSALTAVWSIALSHSTKVLALTIPEAGVCSPELDEQRDALNQMITDHEAENYYSFDFHSAIPYWRMPKEQRAEIWADAVHFTAKGYDLMGDLIGNRLVELIQGLDTNETGAESSLLDRELKKRGKEADESVEMKNKS